MWVWVLAAALASSPMTVTLERAVGDLRMLDGKLVAIEGWLGRCDIDECALVADRAGEQALAQNRVLGKRQGVIFLPPLPLMLSIGSSPRFDRAVAHLQHRRVEVIGRLCYACRFDLARSDTLRPISIRALPSVTDAAPPSMRKHR